MEKKLNKVLEYKHIKEPTDEIIKYIDDRRKGITKSLRTRWKKFNKQCMGGIEVNTIYTIAGISGSGKSSFANSLETDLFDLNKDIGFIVLSFNFEMLSSRQIGRKLSYKMKKTTNELYSGNLNNNSISDKDFNEILNHCEKIKDYSIYYVDRPGNIEEIQNTISYFQKWLMPLNKWLVVILDHTLLTLGKSGEQERETLYNLQRTFMGLKKIGKTTIIQLSQMNREIESVERISNPMMHYPIRRDIFGGDSVFQSSDYVIVLHRPEQLGMRAYGPSNMPVTNMIYMHFLKVREGEPKILSFTNNLKHNSIEETDPFKIQNNT